MPSFELTERILKSDDLGCESKLQLVRWLKELANENLELRLKLSKLPQEKTQERCFSFWQWLFYGR